MQINYSLPDDLPEPGNNSTANTTFPGDIFGNETLQFRDSDFEPFKLANAIPKAPIFLCCCAVSLAAVSAFLRSGFILKLITMLLALLGQMIVLGYSDLYMAYNLGNDDG